MYPKREAFPNPPVVVVAAEVLFTDSPRLRQNETLDAIAIALEGRFPFTEPLTGVGVAAVAPGMPAQLQSRQGVLLRNAERTEAVTITAGSLTYETSGYTEFDSLHTAMGAACQALVQAQVAPELKRVGLRYIDEIRVAQPVTDARQWGTWVDASLLGPMAITPDHVPSAGIQGAVGFDLGGRGGLKIQFASFTEGATMLPGHLRRRPFEPGPFFALDFDGFVEFGAEESVRLDAGVVTELLAKVHAPLGAAFQGSITDAARALFRGGVAGSINGSGGPRHRSESEPPIG
ncbi:TIGR04255 family protein [Mycobacterium sp. NBC_00419]|uniref:TIGR04255 family protein n=1 Tax=Mycobacterium sp. NBC_00419 TaxID=2975989 RepID=UPI002E218141